MFEWYVDGHYVFAESEQEALQAVFYDYGHRADTVRPWTDEDQAELDRLTDEEN